MLNFFDSVSCETIIAENEAYEQVLAMVRLHLNIVAEGCFETLLNNRLLLKGITFAKMVSAK